MYVCMLGGGGGWLCRSAAAAAAGAAGLTDGQGVLADHVVNDGSVGGLPCQSSRSHGWHTHGGFGGGGGGCLAGGAGGGYTGENRCNYQVTQVYSSL